MSVRPGPRNLISDVAGLTVGHAQDDRVKSGVTVLLPETGWVAAADIRGGGPGTRETDALGPGRLVARADALVFSGGSAFGLAAADGVMNWLAARGRGYDTGAAVVPIVPAAILYDLANEGDKHWGMEPPYRALALSACEGAGADFALGRVGAGRGARAGGLPGGIGSASAVDGGAADGGTVDGETGDGTGVTVGALAAVNSFGSVTMADGTFLAWPFEMGDEFGGRRPTGAPESPEPHFPKLARPRGNTTLVAVATDAALDHSQAIRLAAMAQDGLARAIRPAHTPFDGDSVFTLASGAAGRVDALGLARIGAIAADCVARAIARAVYESAEGLLNSAPTGT
ncbi:P1 family peptidase [Marivibrio halodurans]|uniref:P1 family peptidase n=1 Tax=Marivibrio halodurans TaxID=2039722 RepID=A0A8J7S9N8_9PROT|nr:P1 family peptidase [Marivibrio halodurans]MBP5858007.1 P1 family peptidase [Marivibrio halodurans]